MTNLTPEQLAVSVPDPHWVALLPPDVPEEEFNYEYAEHLAENDDDSDLFDHE
jgi:hypothetical protein